MLVDELDVVPGDEEHATVQPALQPRDEERRGLLPPFLVFQGVFLRSAGLGGAVKG